MSTKWDDTSWQKDFLNMKSHSPSDAKILMGGVKGLKDAWRLGVLHVEYEKLKKKQMQQDQLKTLFYLLKSIFKLLKIFSPKRIIIKSTSYNDVSMIYQN